MTVITSTVVFACPWPPALQATWGLGKLHQWVRVAMLPVVNLADAADLAHRAARISRVGLHLVDPQYTASWKADHFLHIDFSECDALLQASYSTAYVKVMGGGSEIVLSVDKSTTPAGPYARSGLGPGFVACHGVSAPNFVWALLDSSRKVMCTHDRMNGVWAREEYGMRIEVGLTVRISIPTISDVIHVAQDTEIILLFFEEGKGVSLSRHASDCVRQSDYFRALWVSKQVMNEWCAHDADLADYDASIRWRIQDLIQRRRPRWRQSQDSEASADEDEAPAKRIPARSDFRNRRVLVRHREASSSLAWKAVFEYLRKGSYSFRGIRSVYSRSRKKASSRSVYRVAHLLGLDELAKTALAAYAQDISEKNFMTEALSPLNAAWPELSAVVLNREIGYYKGLDNALGEQLALYAEENVSESSAIARASYMEWMSTAQIGPDEREEGSSSPHREIEGILAIDGLRNSTSHINNTVSQSKQVEGAL